MRRNAIAAFIFLSISATSAFAYQYTMWVPGWGSAQLNSIQLNAGALTETNPFWYQWNSDFTIAKKSYSAVENPTWRAAMTGTLIVPTITNSLGSGFDRNIVVQMLSSAANREAHANHIVKLVLDQGYDGIDIDYERVPTSSRANFTAFIATLSQKMRAVNKKLSICVYAKTSDAENWDGAGAQDWSALGQLADSIKIMAYDYSYSTSAAGPIAPLAWLDGVARYATSVIPGNKIIIGLPFYGYDWSGNSGTDVSYATAMATAQRVGATVTRDNNGEATFSYSGRTVYFQDATSYKRKIDLLKQNHPSIGGFAAWAAGMEDPDVWKVIKGETITTPAPAPVPTPTPTPSPTPTPTTPGTGNGGGTGSGSGSGGTGGGGVTPVSADFAIVGPTLIAAKAGATASASFSVTPLNGFAGVSTISFEGLTGFVGTVNATSTSAMPNTPVTVRVTPSATMTAGIYQIVVRFTSGTITHEQIVNVVVKSKR